LTSIQKSRRLATSPQPSFPTTIRWRAEAIERVITALRALVPISHIVLLAPHTSGEPDSTRRSSADCRQQLIACYGALALVADAINGLFFTLLDAVPEDLDDEADNTRVVEALTLLVSGFSWLGSFPSSPSEPGGYPYNIAHPRHKVNKDDHAQEYWERVLWAWRTGMLGFDFVYMGLAFFVNDTEKRPQQRLRRADKGTAGFLTVAALVDIGLAGRFLHEVDEKQGREIANEVIGKLPDVACLFRHIPTQGNPVVLAGVVGMVTTVNVTAMIATTTIGTKALKENLRFFEE
jgi:hypothetical protein